MVLGLGLLALAWRSGLRLRRGRTGAGRRSAGDRGRHLRVAKPAVGLLLLGAVTGPLSWLTLRGGELLETFHGWLGLTAAVLLIATAALGRRLERGESRSFDVHALLAGLSVLVAALAAMAGLVLLP